MRRHIGLKFVRDIILDCCRAAGWWILVPDIESGVTSAGYWCQVKNFVSIGNIVRAISDADSALACVGEDVAEELAGVGGIVGNQATPGGTMPPDQIIPLSDKAIGEPEVDRVLLYLGI